jgi:hypothetical protein
MGELLVGEPAMLLNLPKFALHLLLPKENDRSRCFSFDVVIFFPILLQATLLLGNLIIWSISSVVN